MQNQFEVTLKPSRHKRKIVQHVVITSNDVDSKSKHISYNPNVLLGVVIAMCVVIGGLIGVIYFEKQQIDLGNQIIIDRESDIAALNATNSNLNQEIASLNNKIRILSDTVNTKTENEAELTEALETQWLPNDFPLTGSAFIIDTGAEDPMVVLKSTDGATVVATASGIVEAIEEDEDYGNLVIVDHGNGYKTYYRNKGQVMVKKSDDVVTGTTIFIITSDNERLCYQISFNGEFINPMDILDING